MDTASIQVILPSTFLVEVLGGTNERGHGWSDLSIHSLYFDFISYHLAGGCCRFRDANLNLLFCQNTLLPHRSAYTEIECP